MSFSLSRPLPQPLGRRGVLPALCAAAWFGTTLACTAEPPAPVHTHTVEAAAGDFVRAVVQQKSDVRVELFDPEGREIVHVDGPNSIFDDEEIAAVAERAGLHQLRVLGCPPGAPAAECYTLDLDAPRPATEEDRRRAEAVRLTQEAVDAMARQLREQVDTWREQLTLRERALPLWRGLGERRREAEELYQLGVIQRILYQTEPAARRLHEAATIYADLGDPAREAKALIEAGLACQDLDHLEEAREDFRQALDRARQTGDRKQELNALNNLGVVLSRLGEQRESISWLTQALALARELGDPSSEANNLVNLGSSYAALSERQKALEAYQQALTLTAADLQYLAAANNNLGGVYEDLGNWDEAIKHLTQAIEICEKTGDTRSKAATLNNLGLVYRRSERSDLAQDAFEKAIALARATGYLEAQVNALNNLGYLYEMKGATAQALAAWRQVDTLAAGHRRLERVADTARAAVQRGEGKLDDARATLIQGIARSRARGDRKWEAEQTIALARVERQRGDLPSALAHAKAAVEQIESLRGRVVDPDLRALFLASSQSYYERLIDILMDLHRQRPDTGFDAQALQVSEQARARGLLDLLAEAGADIRKGADPALLERERRLRAALRERDSHYLDLVHRKADARRITEAEERLNQALADHEKVEAELRATSLGYAALTQPQPLSVAEIQGQVLGEGTLLLEYALGEERSYLWAVTATTAKSFNLPPRRQIEEAARTLYDALKTKPGAGAEQAAATADRAGRQLAQMILGPVERLLGDHTLLVVADGVLQYIPFSALPMPTAPDERVLAHNQVVYLPSASILPALRNEIAGRQPGPKTLAVLGDPVFPGDPRILQARAGAAPRPPQKRGTPADSERQGNQIRLAPLPHARRESEAILGLVSEAGQRLEALGFDATYALAVSGDLSQYRYVHFATHGLLDSRQPELSKLALSQFDRNGKPLPLDEGFLRLADIYNLELRADLVALSACQTALGKEVRREGLVGLTRGFMYAGAARVLASLWSVDDRATAKLMESFYHHLLVGKRPAADALRRAQLEMASRPERRSPYYWAGFSLQGEWK